ncbi:MAG: c-type cytochrome [Nitrospirae bacterium]|nr:c-type cytochrome [Nitrospirota bacterium]
MSNNAAKNLFIYGSLLCFVVLIILTVDTMGTLKDRAPEITEKVDLGKQVWHKYDCIGCHTIFGNGSYFAPDMTKVTERKPLDYLKKFIMNPRAVKPGTAMPVLGISAEEADNLIAFLVWTSKVDTNGWPPKPILALGGNKKESAGEALFRKNDCAACHQINGMGGTAGPDLTHVGSKRPDINWHMRHLKNPQSVVPDSAMPPFEDLTEDELADLAGYLIEFK